MFDESDELAPELGWLGAALAYAAGAGVGLVLSLWAGRRFLGL